MGRDMLRATSPTGVDEETLVRLEHILLSHPGRTDYGAVMPPLTMEALIVHLADDADARIVGALEAMHAEPNSDWTSKRNPTGQKWYRGASKTAEQVE
jgi:3'-5' exoribonuclease